MKYCPAKESKLHFTRVGNNLWIFLNHSLSQQLPQNCTLAHSFSIIELNTLVTVSIVAVGVENPGTGGPAAVGCSDQEAELPDLEIREARVSLYLATENSYSIPVVW